jgi:hypothetical protein
LNRFTASAFLHPFVTRGYLTPRDLLRRVWIVGSVGIFNMVFRLPANRLCRAVATTGSSNLRPLSTFLQHSAQPSQRRWLATPAPPVTQNSVGSQGPTAMVFLNMGGPSTVDEVGDFLSRLFVSAYRPPPYHLRFSLTISLSGRWRLDSLGSPAKLYWTVDRRPKDAKNSEAIRCNWRRVADSKMV